MNELEIEIFAQIHELTNEVSSQRNKIEDLELNNILLNLGLINS